MLIKNSTFVQVKKCLNDQIIEKIVNKNIIYRERGVYRLHENIIIKKI